MFDTSPYSRFFQGISHSIVSAQVGGSVKTDEQSPRQLGFTKQTCGELSKPSKGQPSDPSDGGDDDHGSGTDGDDGGNDVREVDIVGPEAQTVIETGFSCSSPTMGAPACGEGLDKTVFAAGWRANVKTAGRRKGRGVRPPLHGTDSVGGFESFSGEKGGVGIRKGHAQCSDCGQTGHWTCDPGCPNVIAGKTSSFNGARGKVMVQEVNARRGNGGTRLDTHVTGGHEHRG